jgi:hypothetical protein
VTDATRVRRGRQVEHPHTSALKLNRGVTRLAQDFVRDFRQCVTATTAHRFEGGTSPSSGLLAITILVGLCKCAQPPSEKNQAPGCSVGCHQPQRYSPRSHPLSRQGSKEALCVPAGVLPVLRTGYIGPVSPNFSGRASPMPV